jgi:hypothetical protein
MSAEAYTPVKSGPDFLNGFGRVRRPPARLTEAQRARWEAREARIAAAAEFVADLISGAARAYYLREAVAPSSPEMVRVLESNYPGLLSRAVVAESQRGGVALDEAMSVSDFPLLMGDVLDRSLLQRFAAVPQVWRQYIGVGAPLRDFRTIRMLETTGGNDVYDAISDLEGLTYTTIAEGQHTMAPALYGKAMRLSWRLMQNDDLDAFSIIPRALAQGGARTINQAATDILFDSTGPDASIFTTGKGNRLASNPALSITSLGAAVAALMGFTDSTGEPINVEGVRLVVGPGLYVTAQNILKQVAVRTTIAGGVSGGEIETTNWLAQGITLVVDPYIPAIVTGGNAATTWLVTADPNVARPAAQVRFLQGFEQPALYQKAPNAQRIGGGLDADIGDFQSMASEFKGLVAFGTVQIEDKSAIGSNGSGS